MTTQTFSAPTANPESDPFYVAAAEGRFLIRRCAACKKAHWYPRTLCPFCFGETAWEEASGEGTIYSFSPLRRGGFTIAYVTLAEGPTMMTNLVGADMDHWKIGQKVKLTFMPSEGGPPVPCFAPD